MVGKLTISYKTHFPTFYPFLSPTFIFLSSEKVRFSNITGCESTEEPNTAVCGQKVLFVHRKLSEQTGRRDNGACWATTNHRGWVLCFGESAENTKLLKRCAHLCDSDDTEVFIQNAAQPHTENSQASNKLSQCQCWKGDYFKWWNMSKSGSYCHSDDFTSGVLGKSFCLLCS